MSILTYLKSNPSNTYYQPYFSLGLSRFEDMQGRRNVWGNFIKFLICQLWFFRPRRFTLIFEIRDIILAKVFKPSDASDMSQDTQARAVRRQNYQKPNRSFRSWRVLFSPPLFSLNFHFSAAEFDCCFGTHWLQFSKLVRLPIVKLGNLMDEVLNCILERQNFNYFTVSSSSYSYGSRI